MNTIEQQFNRFYKKIKLTKKQRKDAKKKYTGVCKKLYAKYYGGKYSDDKKLVFGSYGKKTNIRPPRDVDVVFILPDEEFDRYDKYKSNGQSQLLQDVRKFLSEKYQTTDEIKAWGKVVLVKFKDGTHNVEVLPAFERDAYFLIPETEDGGIWEEFQLRQEIDKIKRLDKENSGMVRMMIRMLKKWNENTSINISSYSIDGWVVDYFSEADVDHNIQNQLLELFKFIIQKNNNDEFTSAMQTALKRAEKAVNYEKEGKEEHAIAEWIKIFGSDFPKTFDKSASTNRFVAEIEHLQIKYPSEKEEFLEKKYPIRVDINPDYDFTIDAVYVEEAGSKRFLSFILNKKKKISKKKEIIFEIVENTVPKPYELYWKVRNFGEEALTNLRGEISKDEGEERKVEHTQYEGEHYVECYCVKDGVCVARDKILVPIDHE